MLLRPPQISVVERPPAGEVMMVKSLAPDVVPGPMPPDSVMYWHGDAF
jgi:hypothetical protein